MPPYRSSVILLSSVLFVLQCDPSICCPNAGASLSYPLFARSKISLFFLFLLLHYIYLPRSFP
jgi:hypothetical protein